MGLFFSLRHREPCSGAWHHEKILRDNMQKSACSLALGRRWVFQQDNDPKHISKLVPEGYHNQGPGVARTEPRPQSY